MPIFVYRCGCGRRFERLQPRDAGPPDCPDCGGATRKIPAGPRLGRGAGPVTAGLGAADRGAVPLPWRGVVEGGPDKLAREVEFRRRLESKAVGGMTVSDSPSEPSARSVD